MMYKSLSINKNISTYLVCLLSILILVLYKKWFEDKLVLYIIDPFVSKAESSLIADSLLFLLLLCSFYVSLKSIKRGYIISNSLFSLSSVLFIIFLYYRFIEVERFTFCKLKTFSSVPYFDTAYILYFVLLLHKIKEWIPKKTIKDKNIHEAFILDHPLDNVDDDKLDRKESAKSLAERIVATKNETTLAIGINGKWGSGKTSYFNFIKEYLPKDVIVVEFNPWRSLTSKSLIKDFFNTLSDKLSFYSSEFISLANTYSSQLADQNNYIQTLLSHITFTKRESIEEYHSKLESVIKKLNKKIIVFIDDLDRLEKEEIFEVLKLIRNTANFKQVTYIVSYDKAYVNNSLSKLLEDHDKMFLEKIFQIEHQLPFIERKHIYDIVSEQLLASFPAENNFLNDLFKNTSPFKTHISIQKINSVRDAKRLLNSFIYNYSKIKGEVDFIDFFNLELLQLKYPEVYSDLFFNSSNYIKTYSDSRENYWELNNNQSELEQYLKIKTTSLSFNPEKIEDVISLLKLSFGKELVNTDRSHLSIRITRNFAKYFKLTLEKTDISEIEFMLAKSYSFEEFKRKLEEWIEEGKRWELINRFKKIRYASDYKDKNEFENIIKGMFVIANCNKDENKGLGYNGYPDVDIYDKIYDGGTEKYIKKFYANDIEEYKKFLRTIFSEAPFPFFHESSIIAFIFENYTNYEIALSKTELQSTALDYLKKAFPLSIKAFDNYELYRLFNVNRKTGNITEASKLFVTYINKGFLKYYLFHTLNPTTSRINKFYLSDTIIEMFIDYDSFEKYLLEKEQDEYLIEYLFFFTKLKENSFQPIGFEFKIFPIHLKIGKSSED